MQIIRYPPRSEWAAILQRPMHNLEEVERRVVSIMHDVQQRGDDAVREWTHRFDGIEQTCIRVSEEEFTYAEAQLSDKLKEALQLALHNIEQFHRVQLEEPIRIQTQPGVVCWRRSVPIQRVGLYIPGGTAPLFSTVLMLGVPSKLASVPQRILCTPPQADTSVHPAVLYTARLVGIHDVFKVGGAQAIAAMTFGTATIPKVDKIFGPGNQYVTIAKQLAQRYGVAIDIPAGPSEVAVFADASCRPAFVAADLLSQAEHGTDSQVMLITVSEASINAVLEEIERQMRYLSRAAIAEHALRHSRVVLFASFDDALEFINEYAPEHLILASDDAEVLAERVVNAGSVFVGHYSPEAAGDYASGTNHTLPTNGYARAYSGVSVDSFVKKITFQSLTPEGIRAIGSAVEILAEAEGLDAHRRAITVRTMTVS
ncbi:MAG: histidinol dehydrogenase [Bacteroidota bacterium]|nr:histidinol dehydrogenase [Candidatus Kapabacteria bacterium]MDW8219359.1 histidinol dehydrogenase [Bacteroidota bacterium]